MRAAPTIASRCNGGPAGTTTTASVVSTAPTASPPRVVSAGSPDDESSPVGRGVVCPSSPPPLPSSTNKKHNSHQPPRSSSNFSPVACVHPSPAQASSVQSTSPRVGATPTKLAVRCTLSAPVSPRVVLPASSPVETDLTEINSLLLNINQLESGTRGMDMIGESIQLCSLGGLSAPKGSPPRSTPRTTPGRRGGHSARGSMAEDALTDPDSTSPHPTTKAAQVCPPNM